MATHHKSFSLIIPAHNEEQCIASTLREVDEVLSSAGLDYEIVVVDDGSTDATGEILEQLSRQYANLRVLKTGCRRGKGRALRLGFQVSSKDTVGFTDADGQIDMRFLPSLLAHASDDVVVIGRRVGRRLSAVRRLLSAGYTVAAARWLGLRGITDVGCPLKVFPRRLVSGNDLIIDGWLIDAEILVRALRAGMTVTQVEVGFNTRTCPDGRASRVTPVRASLQAIRELVQLRRAGITVNRHPDTSHDGRRSSCRELLIVSVFVLTVFAAALVLGQSRRVFAPSRSEIHVSSPLEGFLSLRDTGVRGRILVLLDDTAHSRDYAAYEYLTSESPGDLVLEDDFISGLVLTGVVREVYVVVADEVWPRVAQQIPEGGFIKGDGWARGRLFGAPITYVTPQTMPRLRERTVVWVPLSHFASYPKDFRSRVVSSMNADVVIFDEGR